MLGIDLETVRFAQPQYLWLLIVPGVLLVGWVWQLTARRRDARRYRQHRRLPVRERFPIFGSLIFWLCLILASACLLLALSRPTATAALVRTAAGDRHEPVQDRDPETRRGTQGCARRGQGRPEDTEGIEN